MYPIFVFKIILNLQVIYFLQIKFFYITIRDLHFTRYKVYFETLHRERVVGRIVKLVFCYPI